MSHAPARFHKEPEPTWEIAHLFPPQGMWSEEEYLGLNSNRLVEFSEGYIEILPMPTTSHQLIALFLYRLLEAFASARGLGETVAAPLRVRLWAGKFREPDVVFMLKRHAARIHEQYWDGADLVMEVVSDDDRRRDAQTKRREYARAGIAEYWIVDPSRRASRSCAWRASVMSSMASFLLVKSPPRPSCSGLGWMLLKCSPGAYA